MNIYIKNKTPNWDDNHNLWERYNDLYIDNLVESEDVMEDVMEDEYFDDYDEMKKFMRKNS